MSKQVALGWNTLKNIYHTRSIGVLLNSLLITVNIKILWKSLEDQHVLTFTVQLKNTFYTQKVQIVCYNFAFNCSRLLGER